MMEPAPSRILVRGLNWLGDAVMSLPALARVREAHPRAHITLLTVAKLADLYQGHSAIDEVATIAPQDTLWGVARRVRAARADLGLILPNSPRSALELWLAGVPRRVGVAGGVRGLWLTRAVPPLPNVTPMVKLRRQEIRRRLTRSSARPADQPLPGAHHVHHYLHLAAAIGASPEPLAPALAVARGDLDGVRQRFDLSSDVGPWFGMNPGAEYGPAKRWPASRFADVAVEAERRWHCRWVIFGGAGDMPIAEEIMRHMTGPRAQSIEGGPPVRTPLNLAGRTSLGELCALLKICRVLVTNDTGPMHVAAAVGTPVVVPFGSTSPELTGPGLPGDPRHACIRAGVPCSPCFLKVCPIDFRCMLGIEVGEVVAKLAQTVRPVVCDRD